MAGPLVRGPQGRLLGPARRFPTPAHDCAYTVHPKTGVRVGSPRSGFCPAPPALTPRPVKTTAMPVPISQMWTVASYVLKQKLQGNKRYPLVLMLEPLFRCNLACAGCGKIQYPAHILKTD